MRVNFLTYTTRESTLVSGSGSCISPQKLTCSKGHLGRGGGECQNHSSHQPGVRLIQLHPAASTKQPFLPFSLSVSLIAHQKTKHGTSLHFSQKPSLECMLTPMSRCSLVNLSAQSSPVQMPLPPNSPAPRHPGNLRVTRKETLLWAVSHFHSSGILGILSFWHLNHTLQFNSNNLFPEAWMSRLWLQIKWETDQEDRK